MANEEQEFQPTKDDLQNLREWIAKSPHIIQDYDDTILSAFVRGCKGSLQKTKKILEGFNSLGQRYPEIMRNYDPLDPRLLDHLGEVRIFTLPKKAPDGSIVYICTQNNSNGYKNDPYKTHATEFFRYFILSLYVYLWNNDFGSGKWIFIADCKDSTLAHNRAATPLAVKQMVQMLENALPVRLQALHLLNVPPILEYLCNAIKSFTKTKMSERIFVHSTMGTLYEKFPKELLPKEYGGDNESVSKLQEKWKSTVQSFRQEFLEEERKMRSLDPLRPKTDDPQEMVGSFKNLNVD